MRLYLGHRLWQMTQDHPASARHAPSSTSSIQRDITTVIPLSWVAALTCRPAPCSRVFGSRCSPSEHAHQPRGQRCSTGRKSERLVYMWRGLREVGRLKGTLAVGRRRASDCTLFCNEPQDQCDSRQAYWTTAFFCACRKGLEQIRHNTESCCFLNGVGPFGLRGWLYHS